MIEEAEGNILEADAEALVNTVNTVGHMGKGIASLRTTRSCRAGGDADPHVLT
jgi:O-acetyl-ADP-ribose deacetylase (regulator of RNase III)